MISAVLQALLFLESLWAVGLVLLLGAALAARSARQRRRAVALAARPVIREALAAFVGGNNDLSRLRSLAKSHRDELQNAILEFQTMLAVDERLADLALQLGLVDAWCDATKSRDVMERRKAFSNIAAFSRSEPVRRVVGSIGERGFSDPDEQVRLESARVLLHFDDPEQVVKVFEGVLRDTPVVRLLVAPELRRHAPTLCKSAVPAALWSPHARDLIATLRLLASWECGLPIADVGTLAHHPNPAVRMEIMHLLPLLPPNQKTTGAILAGLGDEDLRVSMAAVTAVGKLKVPDAIPLVTSCLRRGAEDLARKAAEVLASMSEAGRQALEGQLGNPNAIAAGAARAALQLVPAGSYQC